MYKNKNLLQKLEYKFGKFAVHNLMMIIVGAMAIVFLSDLIIPFPAPVSISSLFSFSKEAIMRGEVWRIITFIFIPPESSMIFIIFALYMYWLIGSSLENEWGAFKFNIFYLCGIIGTIIAGLITGYATNFYLNLSLFLSFAILFPNFEIRLFFVLPVKMKWLAYLYAAFFVYTLIFNTWAGRIALLVSFLNVILFFGKDFIESIKRFRAKAKWKKNFKR